MPRKRKIADGRMTRPKKKFKKQREYHSSSEGDEDEMKTETNPKMRLTVFPPSTRRALMIRTTTEAHIRRGIERRRASDRQIRKQTQTTAKWMRQRAMMKMRTKVTILVPMHLRI
jgi:hypothetical protein